MQKFLIAAAAAAVLALPATPAEARRDGYYDRDHHGHYDRDRRYYKERRLSRSDRIWRGRDGRYRCRRDNGTTGLVIGAAVGGLAGHEIAGSGDKTLGVILGAAGGGLLGRAIDRGDLRCR